MPGSVACLVCGGKGTAWLETQPYKPAQEMIRQWSFILAMQSKSDRMHCDHFEMYKSCNFLAAPGSKTLTWLTAVMQMRSAAVRRAWRGSSSFSGCRSMDSISAGGPHSAASTARGSSLERPSAICTPGQADPVRRRAQRNTA